MNILTQYSLVSTIYLLVIIASYLYIKFGKREKVKKIISRDVVPVALVLLIGFNALGFVLWLGDIL